MKQLLSKIEALLTFNDSVQEKFEDKKTKDGLLLLRITPGVEVNATVQVVNEDATLTIPEQPELTLEDGKTILIDGEGKITEIKEALPDEEMKEESKTTEPVSNGDEQYSSRFATIEGQIAELYTAVEKLIGLAQSNIENMNSVKIENAKLKVENIDLSKKASAPAINFKKFETPAIEINIADPKQAMLTKLADLRERNKNK